MNKLYMIALMTVTLQLKTCAQQPEVNITEPPNGLAYSIDSYSPVYETSQQLDILWNCREYFF